MEEEKREERVRQIAVAVVNLAFVAGIIRDYFPILVYDTYNAFQRDPGLSPEVPRQAARRIMSLAPEALETLASNKGLWVQTEALLKQFREIEGMVFEDEEWAHLLSGETKDIGLIQPTKWGWEVLNKLRDGEAKEIRREDRRKRPTPQLREYIVAPGKSLSIEVISSRGGGPYSNICMFALKGMDFLDALPEEYRSLIELGSALAEFFNAMMINRTSKEVDKAADNAHAALKKAGSPHPELIYDIKEGWEHEDALSAAKPFIDFLNHIFSIAKIDLVHQNDGSYKLQLVPEGSDAHSDSDSPGWKKGGPALIIRYDNTATFCGIYFTLQRRYIVLIRVLYEASPGEFIPENELQTMIAGSGAKKVPNISQELSRIRRQLKNQASQLSKSKEREKAEELVDKIFPRARTNQGYRMEHRELVRFVLETPPAQE